MKETQFIRETFANLTYGRTKKIVSANLSPAWVFVQESEIGVMIPVSPELVVDESFADIRYYTAIYQLEGENKNYLILASANEEQRNEFAHICSRFLYVGEQGAERDYLIQNPYEWWDALKELIGNVNRTKSVHAVLGELLVYYYLIYNGQQAKWQGASANTVDIVSKEANYEVKSTTKRYDSLIEINSQYQLKLVKDKPLYLAFMRFEESNEGTSIKDVISWLEDLGEKKTVIEKAVSSVGLSLRGRDVERKFILHEAKRYAIDETFPTIKDEDFKTGQLHPNILKITYSIDLTGLSFTTMKIVK